MTNTCVHKRPRRLGCAATLACALIAAKVGRADTTKVPIPLQVALIVKIASYDRHFLERAAPHVKVLILVKANNVESSVAADELRDAFSRIPTIVQRAHEESTLTYVSASLVAQVCNQNHISILVLAPGLSDAVEPLSKELGDLPVLTTSLLPEDVPKGIMIGVDLISASPKILFNLKQAKLQKIVIEAQALNIMKVFE